MKKGISLIVLVITIIVMIILAAAVVITLNNTGIINRANDAINKTNLRQAEIIAQTIWAEGIQNKEDFETIKDKIIAALGKDADKFEIIVDKNGVTIKDKNTNGGGNEDAPEFDIAYGLYKTGTNYTELIYSWEDMIADGVITLTPLKEQPTSNQYGFYFDIKYDYYGNNFVFHEDGSFGMYDNDTILYSYPAGTAIYSSETIDLSAIEYGILTIQDNGKTLVDDYGYYYTLYEDLGGVLYGCNTELAGDLMLPNDGTVISIGDYTKLGSYEYEGNLAFTDCAKLTGIIIPKSVRRISFGAFYYCTSLSSVIFESNCQVKEIEGNAFYGCEALTSIKIPAKVNVIREYAFVGLKNLASVTFEENSELEIIQGSFEGCTGLTSISIPKSILQIQSGFADCTSLETVTFEEGTKLNWIGYRCFSGCAALKEINIPSTVDYIGDSAFSRCTSLKKVRFGENSALLRFNKHAFTDCTSLTSIGPAGSGADFEIPDNLNDWGYYTFFDCTGLTSVRIGDKLTGFADFDGCSSLTSIGPAGSGASVEIPAQVTTIGGFERCIGIETITLPDTIENIGYSAFKNCPNLKKVIISENSSLKTIDTYAFQNCTALTDITFPSSLSKIEAYAFYNCTALANVIFPSSLSKIGGDAFYNCTAITSIEFPKDVRLDSEAFENCTSLTNIKINVKASFSDRVFKNCMALTRIDFINTLYQWDYAKRVYFTSKWNENTGEYTVYCTDGTVSKDGTVTAY